MKNIIITIATALLMASCAATKETSSWEKYCEKYGVDQNAPSEEETIYYLDCYVGSIEEEQ